MFNLVDFPNVIGPNESNPKTETNHFSGLDSKKVIHGVADVSFPM